MIERVPAQSVQHLGFAWFAMVMGLCGLSLAWARATPGLGSLAYQVSAGVGTLAAGVLGGLLLVKFWRMKRFWPTVVEDVRHPLRHVFVAAFPSSLVLLSTVWVVHRGYSLWADGLWMLGSVGLLLTTTGVVGRWLQPGLTAHDFWPAMTPALSLVLVRIGMVGLWPQRMLPTTYITIAPPSVLALSGHQLGVPEMVVHMLAGVALFFALVSMAVLPRCLKQPFAMSFWAMSFPLAASAALGLHLTPVQGGAQTLAVLWLLCVTGAIGGLLWATLRGLIRGQLLVPESVISPPGSTADRV